MWVKSQQLLPPCGVNLSDMRQSLYPFWSRDSGRPTGAVLGGVSLKPTALLAAFLSLNCISSFVVDLPGLASATPAEKKPKQDPVLKGLPITVLSGDEAIEHALNRLAYGPRPGDLERIKQMGLTKWIEQQLNPKSIDDRALDARLTDLPTLRMSTAQLLADYPNPKQAAKQELKAQNSGQNMNCQKNISMNFGNSKSFRPLFSLHEHIPMIPSSQT